MNVDVDMDVGMSEVFAFGRAGGASDAGSLLFQIASSLSLGKEGRGGGAE